MNNQGTPEYCTVAVKVKAPGCSPRIPRGAPDFHHLSRRARCGRYVHTGESFSFGAFVDLAADTVHLARLPIFNVFWEFLLHRRGELLVVWCRACRRACYVGRWACYAASCASRS